MILNRNKLYALILIACLAGYIWLYFNLSGNIENKTVDVCLIKHVTNIPCPSCGSTRSVISLAQGNFVEAFQINPLGYIVAMIMFLTPIWLISDIATKRKTFFQFYQAMETYLRRPQYAILLILLVMINWAWNIIKGL